MRKSLAFLPLLLLIAALSVVAQKPHTTLVKSDTTVTYDNLLSNLKSGSLNIDFKALRMKYTETKDYSPNGLAPQIRDRMYKAINEKNYPEARSIAEDVLKTNYVDISAHLVAGIANEALGDTVKFEFHKAVFSGLISSILSGADGKSEKTGYHVISVPEEYAVLDYFRLKPESQSSVNEAGHRYDVLIGTETESGETLKVFFNTDIISTMQTPALPSNRPL
jgi:hypothetical protein